MCIYELRVAYLLISKFIPNVYIYIYIYIYILFKTIQSMTGERHGSLRITATPVYGSYSRQASSGTCYYVTSTSTQSITRTMAGSVKARDLL